MRFKQWWITTRFYKWLQTFQHEVVLIEGKIPTIESKPKDFVEQTEDFLEKAYLEEKQEIENWFDKLTNKTMEEQPQGDLVSVTTVEPTELEKVVTSLQSHVDNLTTKLGSISEVAKKLNPTGFSSLVTNLVSPAVTEGTGIIDTIKKYVTDAEILAENIEAIAGFIKKQV